MCKIEKWNFQEVKKKKATATVQAAKYVSVTFVEFN